jgi:predicted CXXCH cytochrome family protein
MNLKFLDAVLKYRIPVLLFIAAASFALTYYATRAERDSVGYAPYQPISFSHKLHAGLMGIDCQYCHTGVEVGRHALIPETQTCMNCHSVARKDNPQIQKLTEYYERNIPIPWARIHKVPDYAYFNHSVHVNRGIDCAVCHGDVRNMEIVKQTKPFTMGDCLSCHRHPEKYMPQLATMVNKGPEHCSACHR